tara:strand:+ start:269 stop:502 length:234 start_codon:yes stop_codon:yes gene_type:complete
MIKELTEIELEGHETMNRWEKMEFLEETTTVETHTKSILNELVSWMGDDDFNKFYDYFCSNWEICRSYKELNEKYGE